MGIAKVPMPMGYQAFVVVYIREEAGEMEISGEQIRKIDLINGFCRYCVGAGLETANQRVGVSK